MMNKLQIQVEELQENNNELKELLEAQQEGANKEFIGQINQLKQEKEVLLNKYKKL